MRISTGEGLLFACVGGVALAWVLAQTDWVERLPSVFSAAPEQTESVLPSDASQEGSAAAATATRIYRWRDANGHLNASTSAPPAGVKYTVREYRDDQNVVPSGRGVIGD